MENKIRDMLVSHARHVIEKTIRLNDMTVKPNVLAAYGLIAKIEADEDIPEEVADSVIHATAALLAVIASMPKVSLSPIDMTVATYDDLLSKLCGYVNADSFADDMGPYDTARKIVQEIYAAMDGYLD